MVKWSETGMKYTFITAIAYQRNDMTMVMLVMVMMMMMETKATKTAAVATARGTRGREMLVVNGGGDGSKSGNDENVDGFSTATAKQTLNKLLCTYVQDCLNI